LTVPDTKPSLPTGQAADFVAQTGIDALASALAMCMADIAANRASILTVLPPSNAPYPFPGLTRGLGLPEAMYGSLLRWCAQVQRQY